MPAPGTLITSRDQAPPRSAPTDTAPWFVVGLTASGPTTPTAVDSFQAFTRLFGGRTTYSVLADSLETYFREGGSKAVIRRIVGPAATKAAVVLTKGATNVLKVEARSPGDWAHALSVHVTLAGEGCTLAIEQDGVLVEQSPLLETQLACVEWGAGSAYVTVTAEAGTGLPGAGDSPLTGGSDDRASITDVHRTAALADFVRELGPGQVSIPGATSQAAHDALFAHAETSNRVALADLPDTAQVSTLTAAVAAIRASGGTSARHGAAFAPWARIPGVVPGTTRTVPWSAVQAGLIARLDAAGNPNVPAAGENGIPRFVLGLTAEWLNTADRERLNDAGVNIARTVYGQIRTYGYRTAASRFEYPLHWQLSNVRLDMAIVARAEAIAERYVFKVIDGKYVTAGQFGGELAAMLADYYRDGALFGDEADDAYRVETGPAVNTPASMSEGRLRAVLVIKRSPFAESVEVEVVRVALTEAV